MHRLVTASHAPEQTMAMFQWLADNRAIVESVEHLPLELVEAWADFESMYTGEIEGPWVVVLNSSDDDAVYFKLKWC